MPVPKRKRSRARRDKRFANKGIKTSIFASCKQCNEPNLSHTVCASCGYYKGRKVMITRAERAVKRADVRKVHADKQAAIAQKTGAITEPAE